MKLVGSTLSPFVRRIHLWLIQNDKIQDCELEMLNIFDKEGAQKLKTYSPEIRRVPVLVDGDKTIFDSYLITKYLLTKYQLPLPDLETEKSLVLLNEATDSGLHLFQLKFFNIDPKLESMVSKNHLKRLKDILSYFDTKPDLFEHELVANWLFCTVDWFRFREIFPMSDFPNLKSFNEDYLKRKGVKESSPDR